MSEYRADFLDLPTRSEKPRTTGLTHALDKGLTLPALEAMLVQSAEILDVLKLGWGIALVDPQVRDRALLCRQAGVTLCLGGTLLELAAVQGRIRELTRWAHRIGVVALEVSNGLEALSPIEKRLLIRQLSEEFLVFAETGAKDSHAPVSPQSWVDEMEADIAAGACHVIAEGRESGTVGLYYADGKPRAELVDAIAERFPLGTVIFEAPVKSQQAWFVRRFGPEVGLGNVSTDEVLAVETLRLGLRADTAVTTMTSRVRVSS